MKVLKSWVRRRGLEPALRPLHAMALRAASLFRDSGAVAALRRAPLSKRLRHLSDMTEGDAAAVAEKLALLNALAEGTFHRGCFWREIARLERARGDLLLAATYDMRMMRLLGADRFGDLPTVAAVLDDHGLHAVSVMLQAQYGADASPRKVRAMLDARESAFRVNPVDAHAGCAVIEDRRRNPSPAVTIIVSLYAAAAKIPHFLAHLQQQGLVRAGQCEIIFIDAHSPDGEHAAIAASLDALKDHALFVRTEARETIQAAWNRALGFARGRYVTCLGVDEGLLLDALECLAAQLDADPSVDWVMANSLVTDVDAAGAHVRDVMTYDRRGASRTSAYLDTTYVSWVGGLYRRDIHARFGYYDPAFRAAGDTEFKMRVLRRLKVAFVDRTLGIFFNYPEDRTTASPRAEVEDALAWYAWRSEGGVGYLLEGEDEAVARALLTACSGYRKAFATRTSTDVEFGANIARHLVKVRPDYGTLRSLAADFAAMTESLRDIEYAHDGEGVRSAEDRVARVLALWAEIEARHRRLAPDGGAITYTPGRDNRYEQHSWSWKTP